MLKPRLTHPLSFVLAYPTLSVSLSHRLWGTSVILGFLAPLIVFVVTPRKFSCSGGGSVQPYGAASQTAEGEAEKDKENGFEEGRTAPKEDDALPAEVAQTKAAATITAVCAGDFGV